MNLPHPACMTPACSFCVEEEQNHFFCFRPGCQSLSEAEYIRIVVQAGKFCGCRRFTRSGTDSFVFVGDDGHTDSRSTDENAGFVSSGRYRHRCRVCHIGIVNRLRCVSPEVLPGYAKFRQKTPGLFLVGKSCMITRQCNRCYSISGWTNHESSFAVNENVRRRMESFSKLNDVVPLTPYSAAMLMRDSPPAVLRGKENPPVT